MKKGIDVKRVTFYMANIQWVNYLLVFPLLLKVIETINVTGMGDTQKPNNF